MADRDQGARGPSMGDGLSLALDFLAERQSGAHWRDYSIPSGGQSDTWVTSYVLYRLSGPAWRYCPAGLRDRAVRAAEWLRHAHDESNGGWGYAVGNTPDADSTALAVIALSRLGIAPPRAALDLLRRCVRADGGVSTYPAPENPSPKDDVSGYTRSHADVTPIVFEALGGLCDVRAGVHYLSAQVGSDGLLPSYWWVSPLYPTHLAIDWLQRHRARETAAQLAGSAERFPAAGPFEAALKVLCSVGAHQGRSPACRSAMGDLLASQSADGGWAGSAWMRVPPPSAMAPGRERDAGITVRDIHGVLTTATAVDALARYRRSI